MAAVSRATRFAALLLAAPLLLATACNAQTGNVQTGNASAGNAPTSNAPAATAPATASGIPAALQTQWQAFRAAVLANDTAALAGMTRFPLEVAGTLDDSGVRRIGQDRFATNLQAVLAADSGLSPRQPMTNRELVQRTEALAQDPRRPTVTGDQARLGPFVFGKLGTGWKLTRIYRETD